MLSVHNLHYAKLFCFVLSHFGYRLGEGFLKTISPVKFIRSRSAEYTSRDTSPSSMMSKMYSSRYNLFLVKSFTLVMPSFGYDMV